MNKAELIRLIHATKGRFFSVKFVKADGTVRVANGKDFFRRLVKGGESTHQHSESVPFVDRNKGGRGEFISANAERIVSFKCGQLVVS